jgi:hypothetical protein
VPFAVRSISLEVGSIGKQGKFGQWRICLISWSNLIEIKQIQIETPHIFDDFA